MASVLFERTYLYFFIGLNELQNDQGQGAGRADLKGKSHRQWVSCSGGFLRRIALKNGLGEGVPKNSKKRGGFEPQRRGAAMFVGGAGGGGLNPK